MSNATLPADEVTRWVRDTVGRGFVVANLYKVKMRPLIGVYLLGK
jgi:hypothetical protein